MHGSLARLAQAARRAAAAPRLPRKAALELTDAAAERIRALLSKRDKVRRGTGLAVCVPVCHVRVLGSRGRLASGGGALPAACCLPATPP